MNKAILLLFLMGILVVLSSCSTNKTDTQSTAVPANYGVTTPVDDTSSVDTVAASAGWPMVFNDSANTYTIYEPQCDSWDGHMLVARSAVAVQSAGQEQPTYGVVSFNAITLVDKSSRTATLANFKLISADFPSARDRMNDYLVPVLIQYSKHAAPLSLDRLESSLALTQPAKPEHLDNTPPKIVMSTRPAVLLYIDGPPTWQAVPGTALQRCINTRMLLLKDASGTCYVHLFDGYLQAAALTGLWKVADHLPADIATAEKQAVDAGQVDLMAGAPDQVTQKLPSLHSGAAPDILVATSPTELVQFGGVPQFASIPGTDLLYAVNTSGNVFKLLTDQQTYLLISGRWYRASSLDGPWQFVPAAQLPKDFANIPDTSPKENVKASVPGTPQAEAALIANSIPQSTAVAKNSQMPQPQVDGAMQLAPINGTSLSYVVNSPTPIIEVDPQTWYACQQGVWYSSSSANGPWAVATYVPPAIYSIPPDSPLHYVTYVQVYGADSDQVYEGYTPGYMGTEVADDGTVVYGTGYYYPPWVGTVWYGPPITYGCGWNYCWTPWYGWGFGCGFGWGWGYGAFGGYWCYPPRPWWGCYHGWYYQNRGGYVYANTGANFYHYHGSPAGSPYYARGHNGWNGYGNAYNSRTGQLAAGQRSRVLGVYGSAWNPNGRSTYAQHSGSYGYSQSPGFNNSRYGGSTAPSATSAPRVSSWNGSGSGQTWFNHPPQAQSPPARYGNANQFGPGGWHGSGGGGGYVPRAGGAYSGGGGAFHGGGSGGGGGGTHGGGGGSHGGGGSGGGGGHGGGGGGGHGGGGGR